MPAAAIASPTSAAKSSANTARSVVFDVRLTKRSGCIDIRRPPALAWRTDCMNEIPSSTAEIASTM
ncbi:Uncharacterised protein [Mycobacteroides abscessus subsp. abscessus]|nr:Uncharacterised protein [Mycobacteroides abscessus subsp. abscessus]